MAKLRRKLFTLLAAISLLLCLATVGCAVRSGAPSQDEVLAAAKKAIVERHPDWAREFDLPAEITDQGDSWRVTWTLPPTHMGGVPVVFLRKPDLRPLSVYHTE